MNINFIICWNRRKSWIMKVAMYDYYFSVFVICHRLSHRFNENFLNILKIERRLKISLLCQGFLSCFERCKWVLRCYRSSQVSLAKSRKERMNVLELHIDPRWMFFLKKTDNLYPCKCKNIIFLNVFYVDQKMLMTCFLFWKRISPHYLKNKQNFNIS